MGFTSLDLFSSQFSFNIKGQKMGNRTTTGSIFSIIIIAITFLYCIYVVKQYANNEIEPTYRSQMEINNSTQSLDIISNTFAYKMSFMDVEDDESTDQYTSIQVRAIYENYTLSYPLPVIAEQCRDPNLKYYQCLSQVQFRIGNDESVNQQLYQDIHNPDYNFRLTSLIITVKSCQSFKKNSTDCATQDEIDQMITQGSLNLKLPVYQFNIQTKKMELSYQSQTFYTSSDYPVAFKIQSRGYRDYNYLKSQAIATALFQNGTKTHSIRIISQQCEDPNLKGYDCLYQPFFNSFDNDEIYEKGIQEVQNKDYNYKLTMLIINVGTCFPEFQSDCNQQDELDDIMNRGVISIKLPVSQFDIQQKKLEWSYETFTFYTSSNLVNQPTINQQNQFVFVKDGMFIQSQNIYQSPVNYRVDNSNINRTYLVENQKYAPYFNLEIQLEQKFQGTQRGKGTIIGSLTSITIFVFIFYYAVYIFEQYSRNQIEPTYRSQSLINNTTQSIDITSNIFAYDIGFKDQIVVDEQNYIQNSVLALFQNGTKTYSFQISQKQCQDPQLDTYKCLDQIQFNSNEILKQEIYNSDYNYKLISISLIIGSCIDFKQNEDNCSSQEEAEELMNSGVVLLKLPVSNYNTQTKQMEQSYQTINFFTSSDQVKQPIIRLQNQKILVKDGIFFQSEQIYQSTINYNIDTQSVNSVSKSNQNKSNNHNAQQEKPKEQNLFEQADCQSINLENLENQKIYKNQFAESQNGVFGPKIVKDQKEVSQNEKPVFRSQNIINNQTESVDIFSNPIGFLVAIKDQDLLKQEVQYTSVEIIALFKNATSNQYFKITTNKCQDPNYFWYSCLDKIIFEDYLKSSQEVDFILSGQQEFSIKKNQLVEQKCPKNYKCQVIQSEKTPNDQGESQDINLENNENQSVYQNLFIERQDGVIGPKIMKEVKENAQQIEVLLNKSKIQAQETKNEHDTFMISFQDIKTDENQCITKAHFQNPPSIFSQKQMQTVSNQFMKIQLQETQLTNNYSQPKKEIKKILHKQKSPQTQTQNIFNQSSCSPFTQNSKELNKIQDSLQNKEENFKKLQKIIFTFKSCLQDKFLKSKGFSLSCSANLQFFANNISNSQIEKGQNNHYEQSLAILMSEELQKIKALNFIKRCLVSDNLTEIDQRILSSICKSYLD
ncbi:hypothetical protein ABPG73_002893 [Tetrahymena malaccensis]